MKREFKIIPRRLKRRGALTAGFGNNPTSLDSPCNARLCFGKKEVLAMISRLFLREPSVFVVLLFALGGVRSRSCESAGAGRGFAG